MFSGIKRNFVANRRSMRVIIEKAEKNYSAYIADVDGIASTGATIDEIKRHILEAVEIYKEECIANRFDIPDGLYGDVVYQEV